MNILPSFSDALLQRFLRYVKIWTTSDVEAADSGLQPSTERQIDLAKLLYSELKAILDENEVDGYELQLTEHCYLCARIPCSRGMEKIESVGFLAHMDTAMDAPGENVNPVLENKDDDIIIKTDGSTLLGADDKAGISEIITALEIVLKEKIPHGQIEIIFSPDEETGHGMDNVPLDWIQSKVCYTVDGGELGEIEAECFNAYKAEVTFTGLAVHTGYARGKLANAVTMASSFVSMLPRSESPEATDGYLGFYAPISIEGAMEKAKVTLLLRDFSSEGMKGRKDCIEHFAAAVSAQFPLGSVEVEFTEQYRNMREKLDESPFVMENLKQAVKNAGVEPVMKPIRGGTDGSRLTELGIPTPNIFTGGHNFHSRYEWSSLNQMCYTVKTIVELIKIFSFKDE